MALAVALAPAPALAAKKKKPPAAAPAPPPPSVRQGVELWKAGDWQGAVTMWQPFAAQGDADAMFNIGQAYKLGRAVPVDKVQAREWYRKAALKGHLPASANLGILLFQAGDKAEAVRWLKQAADRGEMRAQYVLGIVHLNGDGAPKSMPLAYAYLARSAAQGLPEATRSLNDLTGVIAPQDRAHGWEIATSLAAGKGVPANYQPGAAPVMTASLLPAREAVQKPLPQVPAAAPIAQAPPPGIAAPRPAPPRPAQAPLAPPPQLAATSPDTISAPVPKKPDPAPVPVQLARAEPQPAPARPDPAASPAPSPNRPEPAPVRTADLPASIPAATATSPDKAPARPADAKPALAEAKPAAKKADIKTADAEAARKKAEPRKIPGWRVQLGAYSRQTQAEAAWAEMLKKQKAVIAKAKPIYEADSRIVKLQMGPYKTRDEAKDACAKVAFAGKSCFVTEG